MLRAVGKARHHCRSSSSRCIAGRRISNGCKASLKNERTCQTKRLRRATTWQSNSSRKRDRLGGMRRTRTSRCPNRQLKRTASIVMWRRWKASSLHTCWQKQRLKKKPRNAKGRWMQSSIRSKRRRSRFGGCWKNHIPFERRSWGQP